MKGCILFFSLIALKHYQMVENSAIVGMVLILLVFWAVIGCFYFWCECLDSLADLSLDKYGLRQKSWRKTKSTNKRLKPNPVNCIVEQRRDSSLQTIVEEQMVEIYQINQKYLNGLKNNDAVIV